MFLIGVYTVWLLACFFGHLTDRFVLFPTTDAIRMPDIRQTFLEARDGRIEVWQARHMTRDTTWDSIEPEAYVLEFTGNGTRAEEIAGFAAWTWRAFPVEVWAMNYPGYGGSAGPARLAASANAALATYDALRAVAGAKPIFLVGNSFGTANALHVAANRPAAGLLLTNPPALKQLIRREFGWWNLGLLSTPVSWGIPRSLDSITNARRCTMSAAFVISTRDEIVPVQYQRSIVEAYNGSKRVLERNAGHNDPGDAEEQDWIADQLQWLWDQSRPTTTR